MRRGAIFLMEFSSVLNFLRLISMVIKITFVGKVTGDSGLKPHPKRGVAGGR